MGVFGRGRLERGSVWDVFGEWVCLGCWCVGSGSVWGVVIEEWAWGVSVCLGVGVFGVCCLGNGCVWGAWVRVDC